MAAIHKHIFFIDKEGIRAYRVRNKTDYEIVKYQGENIYREKDLKTFFQWFDKTVSIVEGDRIDYCFLSDQPIELPVFDYTIEGKASWKQKDIIKFCQMELEKKNYEIIVNESCQFISQVLNAFDGKNMNKIYMQCVPEYALEEKENVLYNSAELDDSDNSDALEAEEISPLNKYFIEELDKL